MGLYPMREIAVPLLLSTGADTIDRVWLERAPAPGGIAVSMKLSCAGRVNSGIVAVGATDDPRFTEGYLRRVCDYLEQRRGDLKWEQLCMAPREDVLYLLQQGYCYSGRTGVWHYLYETWSRSEPVYRFRLKMMYNRREGWSGQASIDHLPMNVVSFGNDVGELYAQLLSRAENALLKEK